MVSGSDGVVAQVAVDEASGKRSVQYLHKDALGSVTLVTDSLGREVSRPHYEPFGKRIGFPIQQLLPPCVVDHSATLSRATRWTSERAT
jgi:hypothetical protein